MRAETRHQLKQDRFSRATLEAADGGPCRTNNHHVASHDCLLAAWVSEGRIYPGPPPVYSGARLGLLESFSAEL